MAICCVAVNKKGVLAQTRCENNFLRRVLRSDEKNEKRRFWGCEKSFDGHGFGCRRRAYFGGNSRSERLFEQGQKGSKKDDEITLFRTKKVATPFSAPSCAPCGVKVVLRQQIISKTFQKRCCYLPICATM